MKVEEGGGGTDSYFGTRVELGRERDIEGGSSNLMMCIAFQLQMLPRCWLIVSRN